MASQWWFSIIFILIVLIINLEGAKIEKKPTFRVEPKENAEYVLEGVETQKKANNFDATTGNFREKPLGILECTASMDNG